VLSVRTNGGYRDVLVQVVPMRAPRRDAKHPRHFLVLFEEESERASAQPPLAAHTFPGPEDDKLRLELASTREYLQSIIEEQEATNEELQSANEEILSSNEELQSINEELETAKEELQSTNEELTTVNEELQRRNSELVQANNDLYNSLASINMPVVMLTGDLKIRRFTPMAERVLRLIPTDIGRPLGDIKPKIDVPDLESLIREVLASNRVHEQEVRDLEGRSYSMRILPYRTTDNRIDGAVLCLIDIEALTRAFGDDVRWSKDAAALIELLPLPLGLLDRGLRVVRANAALLPLLGATAGNVDGRYLYDFSPVWGSPSVRHVLEELLDKEDGSSAEVRIDGLAKSSKPPYRLHARRVRPNGGKLLAIWLSRERG
jgi:two-component system CheB/CheR fusion protein